MQVRASQQALADVQRLAQMLPGVFAVFQDIAEISSIEAAADAAEKRRDGLKTEIEQLEAAKVQAKADAESMIQGANTQANNIASSANSDAQTLREQARSDALQIGDEAKTALSAAREEADRIVLAAKNAAAAISDRSKQAQEDLDKTLQAVAEAQAQLDAANSQLASIEQHKAELKARLG